MFQINFGKVAGFHLAIMVAVVCWSLMLYQLWYWAYNEEQFHFDQTVKLKAQSLGQHNQTLRRWVGKHGGVYVEIDKDIKPNPLLADMPERDLTTPSGRKLTLLNSPAILRHIAQQFESEAGDTIRLVSRHPMNEANYPDDWEGHALDKLEKGVDSVQAFVTMGGVSYFRLMYPMLIKAKCLNCHHYRDNQVHRIAGGLSVIVDKTPYDELSSEVLRKITTGYLGIWVAGLLGLGIFDVTGARLLKNIEFSATHDGLTKLNNRRELDRLLDLEYERASRYQKPLSVLMLDIDHFKQVNDQYGHLAGDKALRTIADLIRKNMRKTDIAGRYGGEELLIVAGDTALDQALVLAHRLNGIIGTTPVPISAKKNIGLTVSIGVTCYTTNSKSAESLLEKADHALYQAKEMGRNRVCHAS